MHSRRSYSLREIRKRNRNTVRCRDDFDGCIIVVDSRRGKEVESQAADVLFRCSRLVSVPTRNDVTCQSSSFMWRNLQYGDRCPYGRLSRFNSLSITPTILTSIPVLHKYLRGQRPLYM